jgi:hypothetical protein
LELVYEEEWQQGERENFETSYFEIVATAQAYMEERERRAASTQSPGAYTLGQPSAVTTPQGTGVSLPKIILPTFSGSYEEWLSFRDIFQALIHNNASLTDVQKLYYLLAALKSEAAYEIHSHQLSSQNYTVACNLLKERYENKRMITNRHVQLLSEQPKLSVESADALRALLDTTLKHFRAL